MKESIKFTQEEIDKLNQLKQEAANIFVRLGQFYVERKKRLAELDSRQLELEEVYTTVLKKEEDLLKSLNIKYGDGNYDPATGVFTPLDLTNKE